MNKYRCYNIRLCVLVLIFSGAICVINILVDPFGIWKVWHNKSVNIYKPEQEKHERLYKAIEIINIKPSIIFIGTSRVLIGLDPSHYSETHREPVYNAAVTSARMNEILSYFKHALQNQPDLKQVIIGIDFYIFNRIETNRPYFPSDQIGKKHITFNNFIKTTASLDALISSIQTVKSNWDNPTHSSFEPNGKWSEISLLNKYGKITDLKSFTSINGLNINDTYTTYEISQERIENFRELVSICRNKNIDIKVFISPSHVTDMEAIRASGKWQEFETLKRLLCDITPIWDFSGFNSITTESITPERQYYWDSSHYKKDVGNMILDKMNGIEDHSPSNFGTVIGPTNIEEHLISIRELRESWVKDNPQIANYINSLKK